MFLPKVFMSRPFQINAVTYWDGAQQGADRAEVFSRIAASGADTVTLSYYAGYIDPSTGAMLATDSYQQFGTTPTMEQIRETIALARSYGLKTALQPYFGVSSPNTHNIFVAFADAAANIDTSNPVYRDPATLFAGVKNYLLSLAAVAQQEDASWMAVGGEMNPFVTAPFRPYWQDIIASVRSVYSGPLTYVSTGSIQVAADSSASAAWTDIYKVCFWDLLDYVGIQIHDLLVPSTNINPTTAEILQAYFDNSFGQKKNLDLVQAWKQLSEQLGKPILFSESGFPSQDGAGDGRPAESTESENRTVDYAEQAQYLDAFLDVFSKHQGSWLAGTSVWGFDGTSRPGAQDADSTWFQQHGMSFWNKPAYEVLKDWYSGARTGAGLSLTGTVASDVLEGGYNNDTLQGGPGADLLKGGAGNDTLFPDGTMNTATLELRLAGYSLQGIAPIVEVWVGNNKVTTLQVTRDWNDSAQWGTSDKFTVDLPLDSSLPQLQLRFTNDDAGGSASGFRDLVVVSGALNGTVLPLTAATASVGQVTANMQVAIDPGFLQLYYAAPGSAYPIVSWDLARYGTAYRGTGSNDDAVDGGTGIDIAAYSGARSDYTVSHSADGSWKVVSSAALGGGADTLVSMERVQFSDGKLALDTAAGQSAASTARVIGGAFGASAVAAHPEWAGIGLTFFDNGMTMAQVCAVVAPLLGNLTNTQFVEQLYANVVHSAPSAGMLASLLSLIEGPSAAMSRVEFLAMAVTHPLNDASIDLVGLQAHGLTYI